MVAAVAAPAAFALPGSEAPIARVSVAECSQGPEAKDRFVEFRGTMAQLAGGETMWMRFGLQERLGDRSFQKVRAPGLGAWRKSMTGVKRFVHRQEVLALAEGSEYRARVQFRWVDGGGQVVQHAVRRSGVCRQPGDLANLQVARIGARRMVASPGVARYAVKVVNRGAAAAPDVQVRLAVDRANVDTAAVGTLEPGEGRVVFVNGPECGRRVRADADPADTVVESDESDNALAIRCPLAR